MSLDFEKIVWFSENSNRLTYISEQANGVLVSFDMPLRSNLTILENIAIIPQYRENLDTKASFNKAWDLLGKAGKLSCALKRDADLDMEERFIVKFLRALVMSPMLILIDRPAFQLPDTNYPLLLIHFFNLFETMIEDYRILDYQWNRPLYNPS